MTEDNKRYRPQAGPQMEFFRNKADIVIFGGSAGGGKTYALLLEALWHHDTPGYNYNVYADTAGYAETHSDALSQKWVADRAMLVNTYDDVDFVWVTNAGGVTMPDEWAALVNFRQISFKAFVIEANL